MKSSVAEYLTALAIPALAALGGASVVFSEIDDAPGGILLGLLLILGAVALSLRATKHRRENPSEGRNHPRNAA